MAKTDAISPIDEAVDKSVNDFASVLAEYGITREDIHVPIPPTQTKANFDQLCTERAPLTDEYGNEIECTGHTGALIFLEKSGEYDGERYDDYDGFYVFVVLHPKRGKTVITTGRPSNGSKPAVVAYMESLTPGAMFCVAAVPTSSGRRVFQPVPVPGTVAAAV